MKASNFCGDFGIQRSDIENWRDRVTLRSKYAETIPGRAREFSRYNVFELAMIAALVSVGCKASTAAAFAEGPLDEYRVGGLKRWMTLPAGMFDYAVTSDNIHAADTKEMAGRSPYSAAVSIDVGDIAARVDRLFEQA